MFFLQQLLFPIAFNDAGVPWQMGFQDPATPIMEGIISLHHHIFYFLIIIVTLVTYLLLRILFLFHASKNPIPLKFTHGTLIEILWTLTPASVLILIAIPSFALLYSMDDVVDPSITIKAIGHQWYWSYEYSDYNKIGTNESIQFDSYMIPEEDLQEGQLRLLEVDQRIVLPTHTHICVVVTSTDVIHSWAVPSLGVKIDAIPGRLNQINLFIKREGVYYGQCSEICGVNHGFMPIVVQAVQMDDYISWISNKIQEE